VLAGLPAACSLPPLSLCSLTWWIGDWSAAIGVELEVGGTLGQAGRMVEGRILD
jgi:hypothetical protein